MSVKSRLDKLYKTSRRITLDPSAKLLFISDLHLNDGGPADDFKKNEDLFYQTLTGYDFEPVLVLLGDILDYWECPDEEKILMAHPRVIGILQQYKNKGKLVQIKGNHDRDLPFPEAIILKIGDLEIFCAHGNQGDFFNDKGWWIGQNVVRYLWVPLQWLGLHDPAKSKIKKHEAQERRLRKWADGQKFISIFGHTHRAYNGARYKNCGSWVSNGGEAIDFLNDIFVRKTF